MFGLILAVVIIFFWYKFLKSIFLLRLKRYQKQDIQLVAQLDELKCLKNDLNLENTQLDKNFQDILALYELTKNVCRSLEEEKVFAIFCQQLSKYIQIKECRYIHDQAELSKYKDYTILPLNIQENQLVGYLAVDKILKEDKEKFGILCQQFLIGLRRAMLYQKVQGLTITDTLTQVYCRRYFLERFHEELKRSQKNKLNLSFLMIDIDNFKQFNDRYGHLVGDAILRQVSKIISDTIRQIDFIGRYGGEELAIVLAETAKDQANFAGQRIRQAIAEAKINAYDEELKVTVSIGISVFPLGCQNMQDLIEKADQALYLAKNSGKNKVCFLPA